MVCRTLVITVRASQARSMAARTIRRTSSARNCGWRARAAGGPAGWPVSITAITIRCGHSGTTPNASSYLDLGTLAPATTSNWFDACSPTKLTQFAGFGDFTYALTDKLKVDVGARVNHYTIASLRTSAAWLPTCRWCRSIEHAGRGPGPDHLSHHRSIPSGHHRRQQPAGRGCGIHFHGARRHAAAGRNHRCFVL